VSVPHIHLLMPSYLAELRWLSCYSIVLRGSSSFRHVVAPAAAARSCHRPAAVDVGEIA
jgi:hypothetical protein